MSDRKFIFNSKEMTNELLAELLSNTIRKAGDKTSLWFGKRKVYVKLNQDLELERQDSLWYGGTVATIRCDCLRLELQAAGIVDVDFYRRGSDGEFEEFPIESFKDKRNGGCFYSLAYYLKNDKELKQAKKAEGDYKLEIEDGNWWECFIDVVSSKSNPISDEWDNTSYVVESSEDVYSCIADCVFNLAELLPDEDYKRTQKISFKISRKSLKKLVCAIKLRFWMKASKTTQNIFCAYSNKFTRELMVRCQFKIVDYKRAWLNLTVLNV